MDCSIKGIRTTDNSFGKKNVDSILVLYIKFNSRWIEEINIFKKVFYKSTGGHKVWKYIYKYIYNIKQYNKNMHIYL